MTNEEMKERIEDLEVTVNSLSTTLFNLLATSSDDDAFRRRVVEAVQWAKRGRLL